MRRDLEQDSCVDTTEEVSNVERFCAWDSYLMSYGNRVVGLNVNTQCSSENDPQYDHKHTLTQNAREYLLRE
jgi:hypothetical protein